MQLMKLIIFFSLFFFLIPVSLFGQYKKRVIPIDSIQIYKQWDSIRREETKIAISMIKKRTY